jgi:hypothetical protein
VAIGTSHGAFKFKHEAVLAFDRIEQIMKTCPGLPLVMHGSSSVPKEFIDLINKYGGKMPNAMGVPEEQIAMAVRKYGVCKVNIDTDLRLALTAKIREVFAKDPAEFDPRKYLAPGARGHHRHGEAQAPHAQQRRQGRQGRRPLEEARRAPPQLLRRDGLSHRSNRTQKRRPPRTPLSCASSPRLRVRELPWGTCTVAHPAICNHSLTQPPNEHGFMHPSRPARAATPPSGHELHQPPAGRRPPPRRPRP